MITENRLRRKKIYYCFSVFIMFFIFLQSHVLCQTPKKDTSLVYINMYIENGSRHDWEMAEDGSVIIDLTYDYERASLNRAYEHWHFLLHAKSGSEMILLFQNFNEIYNGRHVPFDYSWSTACVVSPDGKNWKHAPTEWVAGNRMKVRVKMESDSMYVAHVEPYRLSDLQNLYSRIKDNSLIKIIPIGTSVEGRQLDIIRVGSEKALHRIFIRARAHPWEPGGNWVVEGIIQNLLNKSKESGEYLRNYAVYILPMASIDGVARGVTRFNMKGMDINRKLTKPANPVLSPENAAMERWLEDMISKGLKPDLAIDFHNDANGKVIFPYSAQKSETLLKNFKLLENLLLSSTWFREGTTFSGATSNSFEDGLLARYGIEAIVYELNAHYIKGLDKKPLAEDWILLGNQLCGVFNEYFKKRGK